MAWRPSAEHHKALRDAANGLRAQHYPLWRDDLLQAGLIALWRAGDPDGVSARTIAQRAMVSELRRIHGREGVARQGREHVEFNGEAHWGAEEATPENLLEAKQFLTQLPAAAARCVVIILAGGDQQEAARTLGVSVSRVCQLLTPLRRAMEAG